MTVLMLLAFNFLNKFRCNEDGTRVQHEQFRPERAPLLSYKDDDQSSWGSSYDSASNDEGDLEDLVAAGSLEGKSLRDGESNNTRRLCAICFDAPRDCFFLPCGHCVACFECATRYSSMLLLYVICNFDALCLSLQQVHKLCIIVNEASFPISTHLVPSSGLYKLGNVPVDGVSCIIF